MSTMFAVKNGDLYLQRFIINETYAKNSRAIQSERHSSSEYSAVWESEIKCFDHRTLAGYVKTLIDNIFWGGEDVQKIEIVVVKDKKDGETI